MSYYNQRNDASCLEIVMMFVVAAIIVFVLAYCTRNDNKNCIERGGQVVTGTRGDYCIEPKPER